MGKRLTKEMAMARAAAFESAAEHLLLSWTDDPVEITQGEIISAWLMAQCGRWEAKAERLKSAATDRLNSKETA